MEQAFLRAIIDEPDDDLHRLAYADWLCEQGEDDRADFIRIQVELARLPEPEELTIGEFGPDPDEEIRSRMLCRVCLRLGGCSGRHSHAGEAGQVIHGVLHRHSPRQSHHHCDEKCRPCRWHHLTWRQRELLTPPERYQTLRCNLLPGTILEPTVGKSRAIVYSEQTNGQGMEFSWRRGLVWRYRGPLVGWRHHGPDVIRNFPITSVICPNVIRNGIIFRGDGDGDVPRDFWFRLRLGEDQCMHGACLGAGAVTGPRPEGCWSRGTHAYFGKHAEPILSERLLWWARKYCLACKGRGWASNPPGLEEQMEGIASNGGNPFAIGWQVPCPECQTTTKARDRALPLPT